MLIHVVNPDGLLELTAATVRQAMKDLRSGDPKHQETAKAFLEQAGLLENVATHAGAARRRAVAQDGRADAAPQ